MKSFMTTLRTQRWDDHRYYHHSRINQSLHFVSAFSFLVGYALLFVDPVAAALVGWLVSMTTRQAGHLFFEPTLFGIFAPWSSPADFTRQVAKIWLAIGIGGLLFRTVHLFFIRDVETGLVWMTKILTDPFSDLRLYYKAPLFLLRGELIDPGLELIEQGLEE